MTKPTTSTKPPSASPKAAKLAPSGVRRSVFSELGLAKTVDRLLEEMRTLYREDAVPWIVGYSGGKDSTATLQLAWMALSGIPETERHKSIHVISTDTMVENPVVAAWVSGSLETMRTAAKAQGLPIEPHRLTPRLEDSYWVNLIGRGYPTPRHKFRWCTERLKIKPSNTFITGVVNQNGEAILLLGARTAESQARAKVLKRNTRFRVREKISPNSTLPGCFVYTPIEDWSNDDVWMFLTQVSNPWGHNNKDLLGMYAGASADGECPLVVDTSTPSCGDSRFGCWVCTLVEQDKSMAAMIQNDSEKDWMEPLLKLRNEMDFRGMENGSDRPLRDFRRMSGGVHIMKDDRVIPGPYIQSVREHWLRQLLEAQVELRRRGPPEVQQLELISLPELEEIRRVWVVDKHEIEDSLPKVYEEVTGKKYPTRRLDDAAVLGAEEIALLREVSGGGLHFELVRELLSVEWKQQTSARRAGLHEKLQDSFERHSYEDAGEAVRIAREKVAARDEAKRGAVEGVLPGLFRDAVPGWGDEPSSKKETA